MTVLKTRPRVPIAQVGTWKASTGEWECTPDQLRDAVLAQHDPAFRSGVLKLGHTDARFTDGQPLGDGEPCVGRLENLCLSADGETLYADWVGMPAWLDTIVESAYPSRSVEALLDVTTDAGAHYGMVVTGLALLGVTAPAIQSLGDLADLFGVPRDVDTYVAASRVAASALPEEPMPIRQIGQVVISSASIDELSSAAETWAATRPEIGRDSYVRDIYTDSVIFSSWMGDACGYWRSTWSESGDGTFAFGNPERVRPTYEPVPAAATAGQGVTASALLASRMPTLTRQLGQRVHTHQSPQALQSPRGRDATAGASQGENVPISPALAAALGVGEDADDDAALAAVEKLRTPTPTQPPAQTQEGGTSISEPAPTADAIQQAVAAALAQHTAPILASLEQTSSELATLKAERAAETKRTVLAAAVDKGKITPAQRDLYSAQYDAAPDAVTAILAATAPGTAVPLHASGRPGTEAEDAIEAEWLKVAPAFTTQTVEG